LSTVLVRELVSNLDIKDVSINEVEGLSLLSKGRHGDGTSECAGSALDNLFGDAVLGFSLDSVSADIHWRLSPGDNNVTVTLSNKNRRSLHEDRGGSCCKARNNKLDRGRPCSTSIASRDSTDSHSETKVSTLLLGSSDGVLVQGVGEVSSVEVVVQERSIVNTVLSLVGVHSESSEASTIKGSPGDGVVRSGRNEGDVRAASLNEKSGDVNVFGRRLSPIVTSIAGSRSDSDLEGLAGLGVVIVHKSHVGELTLLLDNRVFVTLARWIGEPSGVLGTVVSADEFTEVELDLASVIDGRVSPLDSDTRSSIDESLFNDRSIPVGS
jgi:hypothetical protein